MAETPDTGMGTAQAVERIEQELTKERSRFDTVMINIGTLLRNHSHSKANYQALMRNANDDMQTITERVVSAFQPMVGTVPIALIFYTADYLQALPKPFRRNIPPSRTGLMTAWGVALKQLENYRSTINGVKVVQQRLRPVSRIYEPLEHLIRSTGTTGNILMVSHVAADWHVARHYTKLLLVESYTGKSLRPGDFGRKMYDNRNVPFFPSIHAVLGDKEFIKPTVVRNDKKQLLATAEQENWKFKTPEFVRRKMRKLGYLKPGTRYPLL